MDSEKLHYLHFVASIERWMESGEPVLTLEYLLRACGGRLDYLKSYLDLWNSEGRIEWLKPLDPYNVTEDVVRFKTYITKDVPWPR